MSIAGYLPAGRDVARDSSCRIEIDLDLLTAATRPKMNLVPAPQMNADKHLVFNRRSSAFIGGQYFFINLRHILPIDT